MYAWMYNAVIARGRNAETTHTTAIALGFDSFIPRAGRSDWKQVGHVTGPTCSHCVLGIGPRQNGHLIVASM